VRVLVTTIPFAERDQTPLESLKTAGAEVVINPLGRKLTESDLANLISDFDIVIAGTEPITEKVLSRANRLKLIARVGIGLDSVDLIAARKREILVSYTPDAPSPAVAELTLGLMIDLLRSAHVSNLRMHQGIWYRYFGQRLARSSLGIIGLGRIGSAVIHHLSGFKCEKILVNDIDKTVLTPTHPHCKVERVDKCMLTAHMGSMSVDCRTQMEIESTAEAIRFIKNQPLLSVVPESEYENQALSR
jgi:D-3-phosphoglycerate dehydrogenase